MNNDNSKFWFRTVTLMTTFLLVFSCSSKDDYFQGKYELSIPSRDFACLVEFQESGNGYLNCDGPIQIKWLVIEGNIILIESRKFNLIFDPIDYDTTWNDFNVVKWQSRNNSDVTLKLIK